ncbi:hypothetical protein Tco_1423795 [Tanacetum coccineum]
MIAERKRFFATQRAAEQRSKPPTKTQMRNRMCTYLNNMGGYKHNQLKGKSYEDIQKLFDKTYKQVNSFVPMASDDKEKGEKQSEESSKRQKMEDDDEKDEKEELRAHLDIISGDDVAIIRVNGSTKSYKIFTKMLDDFDRQDVLDLYRLVKESWRLFYSCGIHVLLMDTGISIHMLVEKTYPLTQEMLSRMPRRKLEVDNESKMAFELLRFTRSQIEK